PQEKFRPEMFGQIRHEETFREVPVVPSGAIVQGDQQTIVYREKAKGVFSPVRVTFGKQDKDFVPVLSGLNAGDRIVTDGAMLLRGSRSRGSPEGGIAQLLRYALQQRFLTIVLGIVLIGLGIYSFRRLKIE